MLSWPWQFLKAVQKAKQVLHRFQPTVVLGTGGYASAAPLTAALLAGRIIAIHEPDAHPGLVNRVFAKYAHLISLGMASAAGKLERPGAKIVVNGNPVSKRFLNLPDRQKALNELGLDANLRTVLVTGGSQGALALNRAVYEMLPMLKASGDSFQLLHQVGDKNWDDMRARVKEEFLDSSIYKPRKYFENLETAYAVADLTVCRAGAMTITELFVTGTPAIFVPFPFAAQDHQTFNARFVEAQGGARVLLQSELSGARLYEVLIELLRNPDQLKHMKRQMLALAKPNAAADLAEQLKNLNQLSAANS
jgi:UDP-N-acetylglucosamine--N-acetylmuramyl-(pentapeptide) pyrophosphoryl-undecaprenol N-acetylglucosamine transferase